MTSPLAPRWMPAPDEDTCKAVSRAIYRLLRPAGTEGSDNTRYLFGWRQDKDGTWWMEMDQTIPIPINVARSSETRDTLAEFVSSGRLSQDSALSIIARVQAHEGDTLTLGEITPPEWLAVMKTDEQLKSQFLYGGAA